MNANFNENQMIDAGGGNFGVKLNLPAQAPFADLGMVQRDGGWWLNHYADGAHVPAGDYWLIVTPDGTCSVLSVSERDVHNLGSFGNFRKQNGVAFVTPHNEAWPTSSFGFVYSAK